RALKGVTATLQDDGVHVSGIQTVGDLPYHYVMSASNVQTGQIRPFELPASKVGFMLLPQEDGGHIRFAAAPNAGIVFPYDPESKKYLPYQSCGLVKDDGTTPPGYFVHWTDPFLSGGFLSRREDTYTAGDFPMPVGPTSLKVSYAFGAVVTVGNQPAGTPTLPDCTVNHPPEPRFDAPAETLEGRPTHFTDRSTDVD